MSTIDAPSQEAGPSAAGAAGHEARIEELVLDAGPLLTQQQGLAKLAKKYYITPLVVSELRDKRARDHFEWLQSDVGGRCVVEVREPSVEARVAVTAFARQTGDYSVLSQADMSVLALTYTLEVQRHGTWRIRDKVGGPTGQQASVEAQKEESKRMQQQKQGGKRKEKKEAAAAAAAAAKESEVTDIRSDEDPAGDHARSEPMGGADMPSDTNEDRIQAERVGEEEAAGEQVVPQEAQWDESAHTDDDDDDDEEDDEEEGGQWITPDNIDAHKSRSLGLVSDADVVSFGTAAGSKKNNFEGHVRTTVSHADEDGWSTVVAVPKNNVRPDSSSKRGKQAAAKGGPITVACLTGDYAVQNVMLQMGLNLVGLEGHKIKQVRAWVLRCHACFKICKDSERTFCPQCGNATLIRTSVTSSGDGGNGHVQVHLKKNFQYKNRGTKYSLPLPKAGKAAGAAASVPILREDQPEWQRAVARERVQRQKQERSLQRALERGTDSISAHYEDADGLSILLAGKNASRQSHGLPALGVGRGNPNERRRRKV